MRVVPESKRRIIPAAQSSNATPITMIMMNNPAAKRSAIIGSARTSKMIAFMTQGRGDPDEVGLVDGGRRTVVIRIGGWRMTGGKDRKLDVFSGA